MNDAMAGIRPSAMREVKSQEEKVSNDSSCHVDHAWSTQSVLVWYWWTSLYQGSTQGIYWMATQGTCTHLFSILWLICMYPSIQKHLTVWVFDLLKGFCYMVHQVVARHWWPKHLQQKQVQTLLQSKDPRYIHHVCMFIVWSKKCLDSYLASGWVNQKRRYVKCFVKQELHPLPLSFL